MRYFLHLAYDGTRFHGWQVQPNTLTVQQELDRCLSQVLRQSVYTVGSGRTDTGVHASHQVAHFDADLPPTLDEATILYRLNRALPPTLPCGACMPYPTKPTPASMPKLAPTSTSCASFLILLALIKAFT
ncbi:tRNA pseudouridine synthase A [Hymenobacter radiodurans]|uniref:hypothetical protein n=1 Tax=Hymenobacter radiodurans TaxID=2496028 RepID=UPI001F0FA367|nr:hypothetical protein [Hymenobacter radiodurans]